MHALALQQVGARRSGTEGDPRRAQVEIGLMGVPFDLGTTNRPGARHGPRQVRDASALIRSLRDKVAGFAAGNAT
jgi:arginase family enzyme